MTDRQAADNKIKSGERAQMGITGELSTSLQRQRKGKIDEAYKNRMATQRQWVNRKSRGFRCGVTGRNLVLAFSRCRQIPKFDLFRLLRTKHLSLLEPLNKDLLLMKHCWIMGTPPQLLPPWFCWPLDSRLKFHLSLRLSSGPSSLSSSSRISSSLRI